MKKLFFSLLLLWGLSLHAQKTYLHCGQIIDVAKAKTLHEKTIVVSGNTIESILNGYVNGSDTDTHIDLKNQVVMPGFIDMHVHIEHESNPKTYMNRQEDPHGGFHYGKGSRR